MSSSPSISPPAEAPPEAATDEKLSRPARKRRFSARWLLRGMLVCVCLASIALALSDRGPAAGDSLEDFDAATTVVLIVAQGEIYGESRFHVGSIDQPSLAEDAEIRAALAGALAGEVRSVVIAAAPGVYQREVERARRLVGEALPQGKTPSMYLVPHSDTATPQP